MNSFVGVRLKLILDIENCQFIESTLREGIRMICHLHPDYSADLNLCYSVKS